MQPNFTITVDPHTPMPTVQVPVPPAKRVSLENPSVSINDPDALGEAFGWSLPTDAGETVTHERALSISAFWAAVKMISGDVSRLPLQTFRRQPRGAPVADNNHQLWDFVQPFGQANADLSGLKLWRRAMVHALVFENGYLWMDWSPGGQLHGIYNLLPDRTTLARKNGRTWMITEVSADDESEHRLVARPYEEVIHIEGLCLDGLVGCDLVHQAREDIGVALASRKFKAKFFGEGMHAGGVLQVPPGATPVATKKMEAAIEEHRSTSNKAFATLVMRDGFKFHTTQVNPQQAELTNIDESEIRNIARRFMMQPGRLGLRDSVSYNSLEQEKRDYHDTTLSYWLSVIQAELNTKALTPEERREWIVAYNVSMALLWADAATLMNVGQQGVNARDHRGRSIFDADEVRHWFQMPPRDDSDPIPAPDEEDAPDEGRALRTLLADPLRRACRRLLLHAQRAQKKGDLAAFLTDLVHHERVTAESLEPIADSFRAWSVAIDCRQVAAGLSERFQEAAKHDLSEDTILQLADDLATSILENQA